MTWPHAGYLDDPEKSARDLRDRFDRLFREHSEKREASERQGGESVPDAESASMTFDLRPEARAEIEARKFPPNPWLIPVI